MAFLSSGGAAAVHFGSAHPHFEEWAPAGAFMLVCGIAQLCWALMILSDRRQPVLLTGLALHAGTVTIWLVSRTTGLPIGPNPGTAEHIHPPDALATALEILAVVSVLALVAEARPHRAFAMLAGLAAALAVVMTAHDHARESTTAAAALAVTIVARVLVVTAPRPRRERSRDVHATLVRRYVAGVGVAGGAGFGRSG